MAGAELASPTAVTAWAVYLGWLKLEGPLALIGSVPSVAIFTPLPVVESVADKLPANTNRTSPPGLAARIVGGELTGACIAAADRNAFWLALCWGDF